MSLDEAIERVSRGWRALNTELTHIGRDTPAENGTLVNPVLARGSTVLFPSLDAMEQQGRKRYEHALIYGAMGTPVQHRLEQVISWLEGGIHTQVVCSGLAACTLPFLAYLEEGAHCLLPDSVYGPTRRFADTVLKRLGITSDYYPPQATEEELHRFLRPATQIIFAENPGSHTFEFQDVTMLGRVARHAGAKLVLDNTWGVGVFKPFDHGVDVSVQALTKYPGGHADIVLGAVTVAAEQDWRPLRDAAIQLGQMGGVEDCWLALRGLRTMGVRLESQAASAVKIAHWLKQRSEVDLVLHPVFTDCPGHELWQRDFSGAASLFGFVFKPSVTVESMKRMVDHLKLFGIGASWGGYESLVLPTTYGVSRSFNPLLAEGRAICRLHVGLENAEDLVLDLERAFAML